MHQSSGDGGSSHRRKPRLGTPTGAGPADFSQDEHAADAAQPPHIRTFVMRMDRQEPVIPAHQPQELHKADDPRGSHDRAQSHAQFQGPAAAAPHLVTPHLHDPSSDGDDSEKALSQAHEPTHEPTQEPSSTLNRFGPAALSNSNSGLSPSMLAIKSQLISHIIEINPTASHTFLQGFTPRQLRTYLDHLTIAKEPRGTIIRRATGTPAIEAFRPAS